tara:strand:- start:54 stop:350 length:297 start_codon:yes stop_codon:yes gene_type:complete
MGYNDNLVKKRDGSYVLKHKTKKHKEGDCIECGENPKDRSLGGLYRYKKDDMVLVRNHIEDHLSFYSSTKSMTPIWCSECQSLKEYKAVLHDKRTDLK